MTTEAKKESEKLMNEIFPLAERMLKDYGEFHPYGGYMKWNGQIVHVGAEDPDTDHPKSKDLIYILRSSFRDLADRKECKAVAIIFDVAVRLPNSDRKRDAIQVCLDHAGGYSAQVFFPYEIVNHEIRYGDAFAQEGNYDIFGQD